MVKGAVMKNNVILLRGKAATGKTVLSNALSKRLNVPVYRKDDVYDSLSIHELSHHIKNMASYDILAKMIQTSIDNTNDVIVDVSLFHTEYFKMFLSKMDLSKVNVHHYFCSCSDDDIWKERIRLRTENPLPNQIFESPEMAELHYAKLDGYILSEETILDSVLETNHLLDNVINTIKG